MTDSQLIDSLGGTAAVARMCGVKMPAVSRWRATGIPHLRLIQIKHILDTREGAKNVR